MPTHPSLQSTFTTDEITNIALPTASSLPASTFINSASASGLATTCDNGKYGIPISNNLVKVCGLCPAGTLGDGFGCTPCPGGSSNDVVGSSGTCTSCPNAGTYAPAGLGAPGCLPCPAGTYSAAGASVCTEW